ncbi:CCA tRNA nucleotidyltransferase [Candidatus Puniceispirillum marinum]|uniref:Putative poly(A) polymerase n=1 Tax=Puniceispirillum marinum (strain IMCC1322) TaxID=488538 RepID=D5BNZ4_PUNMI|nr:CCA tRNA nucleotidyltransferase [Candidatus Puniceispirillum marinum]ADE40428.1 putative poly(A) polymerase [Candidatus Puniceispirillum marinum IMCC1322]
MIIRQPSWSPADKNHALRSLPPFASQQLVMRIFDIAQKAGGEARIVGGAVRDWLAGMEVGDIDMAVNMPIERFADTLEQEGLRVIHTGLSHGTVTVVQDKTKIEITHTRLDIETDGRHAKVTHSPDWLEDARRRDFTINAIYMDAAGKIFDPLNGQDDLQAGILRFVGDADRRVQEDALRMLRYCRFLHRFGRGQIDADALAAFRRNASLAQHLSGERVRTEMELILVADGAAKACTLMQDTGLATAACAIDFNVGCLAPDGAPDRDNWLIGLASIMPPGTAISLAKRLRLSKIEARRLQAMDRDIDPALPNLAGDKWQQAAWFLGDGSAAIYAVKTRRSQAQFSTTRWDELQNWTAPECPVTGADLLSHGVDNGPICGDILLNIQKQWVASGFTLTKPALLAMISN